MGALTGVIRRLPVGAGLVYDYIPVDVVINQILLTAYHVQKKKYVFRPFLSSCSYCCCVYYLICFLYCIHF